MKRGGKGRLQTRDANSVRILLMRMLFGKIRVFVKSGAELNCYVGAEASRTPVFWRLSPTLDGQGKRAQGLAFQLPTIRP